jgi:hypothetical protein
MKVTTPSIERIVLLGGGNLLLSLVHWCKSEGAPVFVVASPRYSEEILKGGGKVTR